MRWRTLLLSGLLAGGGAAAAQAQAPVLLEDINPRRTRAFAPQLAEAGGLALFATRQASTGYELWRSDGTLEGTVLLEDIRPGAASSIDEKSTERWAASGGLVWFAANDGVAGQELWRSDGTAAGTKRVADVCPGDCSSSPRSILVTSRGVFFAAGDAIHGDEPWLTDGTPSGTHMIADLLPGAEGSWLSMAVELSGEILFLAQDENARFGLWASDGTTPGTRLLSASAGSWMEARDLVVGPDRAWFVASDAAHGLELWTSDGTTTGTHLVVDLEPGAKSSTPSQLTPVGRRLAFAALPESHGGRVWSTDGTAFGTLLHLSSFPDRLLELDDKLWIFYRGGVLRTDTTSTASEDLKAQLGSSLAAPSGPQVEHAGSLLYVGRSDAGKVGVWRTDGTPGGSGLVTEIEGIRVPTVVGSSLFYLGWTAALGDNLTVLPQLVAPPVALGPPGPAALWEAEGSAPGSYIDLGERVVFVASHPLIGREPWTSDGTPAGTELVLDIEPGSASSDLWFIGASKGVALFMLARKTGGIELWSTEGTAAGTALLLDRCPDPCKYHDVKALSAAGGVLISLRRASGLWEHWWSDGTPAHTTLLRAESSLQISSAADVAGTGFFATTEPGMWKLWRTDGTLAGTSVIRSDPLYAFEQLASADTLLWFTAYDGLAGRELWRSDGTPGGTFRALDVCPGVVESGLKNLVGFGARACFTAHVTGPNGSEGLYCTDGTLAETRRLHVGAAGGLTPAGARLFFHVDTLTGRQLWSSDGTAAGTHLVPSVELPVQGSQPDRSVLLAVGDEVVFPGPETVTAGPREPWRSDGSPEGTLPIANLNPFRGSEPTGFATSSRHLFFVADDGRHGFEPWAMPLPLARAGLLRNDDILALDPPDPSMASILPLDPGRDAYRSLPDGGFDPDTGVIRDSSRPLVFYMLDRAAVLRLRKDSKGLLRFSW